MLWRKINICTTSLYFIKDGVSYSFEENSENLTDLGSLHNYLKSLDVASKNLSFYIFM